MAELEKIKLGQIEYDIHDPTALPKSGGTMTGALILYRNPTTANEAATKQYVDAQKAQIVSSLPASGTPLTANTIYHVTSGVGTYAFTPPAAGWAHGYFATHSTVNVSFSGQFVGAAPTIEASKAYEFDVFDGIWAVQEVVSA